MVIESIEHDERAKYIQPIRQKTYVGISWGFRISLNIESIMLHAIGEDCLYKKNK